MPSKKDKKPLHDYNIYKIPLEIKDAFINYLESRQFEEIPLKTDEIKNSNGFSFVLMFCDKDNKKGSPWVRLLSSCSHWDLVQQLKIYGAALICFSDTVCFVISYGNAHFYISNYCDFNFGISVAERLLDLNSVKAQQNVSHNSKLSKMYYDYFVGATLTYRSGEIPTYIKGKTIDKEVWGETINCGTSAQFKWEETPLLIGPKLRLLEETLNTKSSLSLPRLTELDKERDEEKIEELFKKLACAIKQYDYGTTGSSFINIPSFYLLGTRVIQNDSIRFKFTCNYKWEVHDGELTISVLQSFLDNKGFDIEDYIKKINIAIEYGNDQWTPLKPITEYIEFITDDNFCLRNGKWCSFNGAYVERILQEADKIRFDNRTDGPFRFNKNDLISFAQSKGIYVGKERQPYETYYNEYLANELNAICVHPTTTPVESSADGRYKYEICDLYVDETMYFVKIGQPSDFAYAIDPAMLTLERLDISNCITLPNGKNVSVREFRLLLIFDNRETLVEKWADVLSINFLIHLNEIKQRLNLTDISLKVDFAYEKI